MRTFILGIMILTTFTALNSITVETASLSGFMYGTEDNAAYDNFYNRVVEGLASPGYNQYAPWDRQTNGFGNFVNANSTQRANWGDIVDLFLLEMFSEAQDLIDQHEFPYEVVEFNDTDTGRTYYMLREHLNMDYFDDNDHPDQPELHQHGSFDYGWGLYVFNPSSDVPVNVNVVHPKDDFISIPVATKAFQLWDARYLMVAGAGREVLWTNVPPYWNSKSLSDPSRNAHHVFNVTYNRMCDEIRDTFGRREHSVQIHSYDYTHMGYTPLQITGGGWSFDYPGLPIRDLSGNNLDIVNASPYVILPANTIGIHDDVLVTDYYSVLYDTHGLYYDHDGDLLPISNNINLPGATGNRQVVYTQGGWNKYDVFTPFFHIEMEELPSVYPQNMNYYYWFYGFDAITQTWNADDLWTRALAFYTPWLDHYAQILPDLIGFDDGIPPANPENLSLVSTSYNNIVLEWERSYAYDFKTYEILYANEPIDLENPNYDIVDRNNISTLAGQAFTTATVGGLEPEIQYYFKVRAKDYNGNHSGLTNEIARYTGSATIANLTAHGRDGYVDINWLAQFQNNNEGFNIWRAVSGTDIYELIASWETEDSLIGSPGTNVQYEYVDTEVENGVIYDYQIASVDNDNSEYVHVFVASASPQPIYTLTVQNDSGNISDTVEFGSNPFATDGYDSNYDILKGSPPGGEYIYAMSYKSNWSVAFRNLQRDIYGYFDTDYYYKTYVIRARTNQTNQPISISISDNFPANNFPPGRPEESNEIDTRNSEKLYLRDTSTGNMVDLTEEPLIYEASNTSYRYFTLYWGNLLPVVNIAGMNNSFLQAGDQIVFNWSTNFELLVDSIELYLINEDDDILEIAANLPSDTTSYEWTVPNGIHLLDANLVIRTIVLDGFPLDHYSDYKLGVIPSTITFGNFAGWHLKANPLVSPVFDGTILFGPEALLFVYDQGENEYEEVSTYQFGEGHWLFMPNNYEMCTTGHIRREQYDIALNEGWNLIPNVFLTDFKARDLRFKLEGAHYSYIEALQYDMIERSLYAVEESRYRLTDEIRKQESFWLYSKIPDLLLEIEPFHESPDYALFPYYWQTTVMASQSDFIGDEVVIGSAQFTNEYHNPLFDLPKPPHRPETDFYFYLEVDETVHPYSQLHSNFRADLENVAGSTRVWEFVLHIDEDLQPVYFRKSNSQLPAHYEVSLLIDDQFVVLSEEEDFVYNAVSQVISGQIKVTNLGSSTSEELPESTVTLSNYPNPFFAGSSAKRSSGTNISFSLTQAERVKLEIFNIKGQRIKTLLDERRDTGKHLIFWNGKDMNNKTVASGVYLYRLQIGDNEAHIRKMMLIK